MTHNFSLDKMSPFQISYLQSLMKKFGVPAETNNGVLGFAHEQVEKLQGMFPLTLMPTRGTRRPTAPQNHLRC
ncbi:MAG: hypothetical protein PHW76_07165 [Alphaproteobacteria bacterium]|nr:hypothetical protein [Alphaproteobacteria bacterium]